MPILKAGAVSTTFDLDGKEYSKGLYEATYSNVITLADGSSDESKLTIGLRNINTGEPIQEPVMIRAWKNGSNVAYTTLDALILDLSSVAGIGSSSSVSVATSYPTTDITKVGQQFLYNGRLWSYMTQAEIDSINWTGLVNVGFPAPVDKVFDIPTLVQNGIRETASGPADGDNLVVDCLGLGKPNLIKSVGTLYVSTKSLGGSTTTVVEFKNVNLLTSLEDIGTAACLALGNKNLTDTVINDFFTQLPTTTKTATIDVRDNTGSATCDTSIATAKGYTIVTT